MPELPKEPPSSVSLAELMKSLKATFGGWNVQKALKARESYKRQADRKITNTSLPLQRLFATHKFTK